MSKISTRSAYGEALAEIGADENIIVMDADLRCCTRTEKFAALYPERSFNVGIAEANMVGMAAGLAACGKTDARQKERNAEFAHHETRRLRGKGDELHKTPEAPDQNGHDERAARKTELERHGHAGDHDGD